MSPLSRPAQTNLPQGISRRKFIAQVTAVVVSAAFLPSALTGTCFASGAAGEKLVNIAKGIMWTGQASVKIPGLGPNIYVDPYYLKSEDKADIVLITHSHQDHLSIGDLRKVCHEQTTIIAPSDVAMKIKSIPQKETIIVAPGDTVKVDNVTIHAVHMYNVIKTHYHPKSNKWVGYTITGNGVTVYHAGDTERIPEMKDIQCDIALLPLGQTYTMNSVEDAAESAKDVKAKLAVPIHYGMYEGSISDADKFKALLAGTIDVIILEREK